MIHIAAFSSSPRSNSNSRLLMDAMLGAVPHEQAVIHRIDLSAVSIAPCRQCDYCQKKGCCVIRDDMDDIVALVEGCDVFVLASPIYFMAHNAQAKLMLDRFQVFWSRKYILKQPLVGPQYGIHIAVGATHGTKVFDGVRTTMKWVFDAIGVTHWDELFVEGCDAAGGISQHIDALNQAKTLGRDLLDKCV
jgi:multimeric flavodoxin WrbA